MKLQTSIFSTVIGSLIWFIHNLKLTFSKNQSGSYYFNWSIHYIFTSYFQSSKWNLTGQLKTVAFRFWLSGLLVPWLPSIQAKASPAQLPSPPQQLLAGCAAAGQPCRHGNSDTSSMPCPLFWSVVTWDASSCYLIKCRPVVLVLSCP